VHVLFVFRHGGYVRNFQALLVELARRGHTVHAVLGHSRMRWLEGRRPPIELIAERHPEISWSIAGDAQGPLTRAGNGVRGILDWLRYLGPEYANAPKLKARVEARVPAGVRRILLAFGAARPGPRAVLRRILEGAERALPWPPALERMLRDQQPDVVCVTPLVDLGNNQPDVLRAARSLGLPTVLCVASWDNLTNKGMIRGEPDYVTVWNEFQRDEAIALHRQRPERVLATGAHSYDHWFAWEPARSRAAFCAEVGLDAERPFVLFLGSSPFIAPGEVETGFVRRWIAALRDDPRLRELGVLVRPHPQNGAQWRTADLSDLGAVAVWPRGGADPVDAESRADFHDSIEFCAAVVGINTSALIESAVVGRPVLTVLADEFRQTQEGTLHFEHLRRAGGGMLIEADDLDTHREQLAAVLDGGHDPAARNRFLEAFVRPQGLDVPSAPVLADALERAAVSVPAPHAARGVVERLARAAWPLAGRVLPVAAPGVKGDKTARAARKAAKAAGRAPTEVTR
jgi:hypothetical protein